jgi:CTP synthase (UTP-ammonia lyase)
MIEYLLYFFLFILVIGINLLIKNKNFLFEQNSPNRKKTFFYLHRKVRSRQKSFYKSNKKYSTILPKNSVLKTEYSQTEPVEIFENCDNEFNCGLNFNTKTAKTAMILKEVFDLPLALR